MMESLRKKIKSLICLFGFVERKITRHRSYIKTDRQMKKYKRNKFNEKLEYGFKLLSENKDYED